jgi:hypothetical protein
MNMLTHTDWNRIKDRARRTARGVLTLMGQNASEGKVRRVRTLMHRYFMDPDVRLHASFRACAKVGLRHPATATDLVDRINVYGPSSESATLACKAKRSGGFRNVMEFGPVNRARQILVLDVLKVVAPLPSWRYDRRGLGREKAIMDALDFARSGNPHFIYLDVADCYQSFDRERIRTTLPLSEGIIRSTVLCEDLVLERRFASAAPIRAQRMPIFQPRLPEGLPQGSTTSSYVAALLLSDIADLVPSSARCFAFGDDLLLLAPTKELVDEIRTTLFDAYTTHRSGIPNRGPAHR